MGLSAVDAPIRLGRRVRSASGRGTACRRQVRNFPRPARAARAQLDDPVA